MSLSTTTRSITYTGTDALSVYAYTFRILDDDDLTVTAIQISTGTETVLTKTTDYTVSNVGITTGGNVTLVNASQAWLSSGKLSSSYQLKIERVMDIVQSTDIRNQGDFYPETHEDALDYLTMICQQLDDRIDDVDVGVFYNQVTQPATPTSGRTAFWWDAGVSQMKMWNGSEWMVIGG